MYTSFYFTWRLPFIIHLRSSNTYGLSIIRPALTHIDIRLSTCSYDSSLLIYVHSNIYTNNEKNSFSIFPLITFISDNISTLTLHTFLSKYYNPSLYYARHIAIILFTTSHTLESRGTSYCSYIKLTLHLDNISNIIYLCYSTSMYYVD